MKDRELKSKLYLTNPDFVIVFNKEYVDISKFGEDSIVKTSEALNIQFDKHKAQWTRGYYHEDMLEDETQIFGIGIPTETTFYHPKTELVTYPSIYTDYPNATKVISYHLYAKGEQEIVGREIYTAF